MKCRSGKHEWSDPIDASRCCCCYWRRVMVPRGEEETLDRHGRHPITCDGFVFVYGWVQTEDGRKLTTALSQYPFWP
jgi:hypothetical protein